MSALLALPASAQEPSAVVISEINFAGSSASTADEWLELANVGDSPVDLSNWIVGGAATGGEALAIAAGTVLAPHQTLVIANYPRGNEKSTLNVDPELVTSAVALANSNLTVFLTLPDGTIVDQYADSGVPDFGTTSPASSIERDLADLSWHSANQNLGLTDANQLGTPGSAIFNSNASSATSSTPAPVAPTPVVEEPTVSAPTPAAPVEVPLQCVIPPTVPSEEPTVPTTPTPTVPSEPEPVETSSTPTVPSEEPAPTPSPTPAPVSFHHGDVVINEIYSDSGDGDEWVELLNTQSTNISLTGWSLQDASGKVTTLSNTLNTNGLTIVINPAGKLNNGGDTVSLIDPSGNTIDSVIYGTDSVPMPTRAAAAARDSLNNWYLVTPTPGTTNIFPDTTLETSPNVTYDDTQTNDSDTALDDSEAIEGAVEEPNLADEPATQPASCNQLVVATASPLQASGNSTAASNSTTKKGETILEGVVVAAPETFGAQTAFINGHELYFYHADWPDLTIGSFVRVTGAISQVDGHERLKIASAENIALLGRKDATPLDLTPGALNALPHGTLVRAHGVISERNGKRLTLIDDNGESITIFAHDKTHISLGTLAGAEITVTGIVRQTKNGTEIMPRSAADLVTEGAAATSEQLALSATSPATDKAPWVGGGLLTGGLGAIGTWFVRSRKLSLA